MPDILIHHCTLHIVRSGGCAWGAEPNALAREAVAALGVLLERQLGGLWPESDDVDVKVATPVRVFMPVDFTELKATADDGFDDTQASRLHERFRAAVEQAVKHAMTAHVASRADTLVAAEPPARRPAEPIEGPRQKLQRLLAAWSRRGELESILLSLGEGIIEAWHRTLLTLPLGRQPSSCLSMFDSEEASGLAGNVLWSSDPVLAVEVVGPAFAAPCVRLATRFDVLRARIIAAVEAADSDTWSRGAAGPAFVAALDRSFPLPFAAVVTAPPRRSAPGLNTVATETAGGRGQPGPVGPPHGAPRTASAGPGQVLRRRSGNATEVGGSAYSALPFLMLGSLSKIGYLEALDATLSAADLLDEASLFATALAYKVLNPPSRGWRRSQANTTSAAIFAGLEEPASNEALAEFARQAADFLPVLDRVVADALASSHEDGSPLLLCEVSGGGWLLAEVEGVFPVAWSWSWDGLLGTVERFGRPRLLVPASSAGGGLLTRLDTEGFRFITDTAPTRGECWRRFHRLPHERWCTNDTEASEGPLVASARKLASPHQSLQTTWEELALRPCVAPSDGGALETSLMLSAAVALADLSWNLWKDSGDTDPLLALERFSDLEARVRFRPDEILVKLPLGKRSIDLSRHGLLDDVAGVPWYGGRVMRFSGG